MLVTLYAAADGRLVRLHEPDVDPGRTTPSPTDAPLSLAFDPETNAVVVAGLRDAWHAHRLVMVGGVTTLQRAGVAVPIAPEGQASKDRALLDAVRTRLAPGSAALTDAEIKRGFRLLFRDVFGD